MPVTLTTAEREACREMLTDLIWHHNEISLVPAPQPKHRGHKIRVQTESNSDWYRSLARDVGQKRRGRPWRAKRFDSDIRRDRVRACLKRLANGAAAWRRLDLLVLPYVRAEVVAMAQDCR